MSVYSCCMFMYLHCASWHSSATMTEAFPCFFLNRKANDRVKPAKTGHGPHSSKLFVLFYVSFVLCRSVYCVCVWMCTVLLPSGGYPISVNKYVIPYSIIYTEIFHVIHLCMVLKLGHFGESIRNTWKFLKCSAGEGWRRSVRPIVWEMKYYIESRRTWISNKPWKEGRSQLA